MFERTFFVLSPNYHGVTLLAKLIKAHPELTALGNTYPSNAFDQDCEFYGRHGILRQMLPWALIHSARPSSAPIAAPR